MIHRATEILNHHISQSRESGNPTLLSDSTDQLTLFKEQESRLRKDLNTLDVNSLTPLEALQKLNELKKDHEFLLKGNVFTKDVIDYWVEWKMEEEVKSNDSRPHPHEFEMYFNY